MKIRSRSMPQSSHRINIYGRVQGVWFRVSAKKKADELGLSGSVKNQPDGSVRIEVTGQFLPVQEFVKWCHIGPELARVENVEVEDISPLKTKGFEILR